MQINPYLHFDGRCEAAFRFYEQRFGGKIQMLLKHSESPEPQHVPEAWRNTVMHARMTIGDQVLLGSDCPPDYYHKPAGFYVSLDVATPAEARRLYDALAQDGEVNMPLQKTFWSASFAMLRDRFGIPWMINCTVAA